MSFILDALKKSEAERQQAAGAEFSDVPTSSNESPSFRWVWILAGLLAVNVAVLLGILLRPQPEPQVTQLPEPVDTTPAVESKPAPAASFEERVSRARAELAASDQAQTPAAPLPAAQPEPAAATPPPPSRERIRTIDELRLSGELQMGELHLDIHVYSDNPADRFVFVNMVKHREQSRLSQGPVVSEITPDGVILDYEGKTFLLPRE
jgi:general secretion pathway protein B